MREKQHQRGLSSGYLEPDRYDDEEDGEEAVSLAAIKSKYKGGGGLRGEEEWMLTFSLILFLPRVFVKSMISNEHPPLTQRSEQGSTRPTVMKAPMMTRPRG